MVIGGLEKRWWKHSWYIREVKLIGPDLWLRVGKKRWEIRFNTETLSVGDKEAVTEVGILDMKEAVQNMGLKLREIVTNEM